MYLPLVGSRKSFGWEKPLAENLVSRWLYIILHLSIQSPPKKSPPVGFCMRYVFLSIFLVKRRLSQLPFHLTEQETVIIEFIAREHLWQLP